MHYLDHLLECPIGPSLKVLQLRRLFDWTNMAAALPQFLVVVVLRSPIHANEPSEYNGMLYRTSNRVLNNGIKVIIHVLRSVRKVREKVIDLVGRNAIHVR